MFDLSGLWVPVVTPFDEDDRVDAAALGRLCERVLADGAAGLVTLGTTGEPATLRAEERRLVADMCASACSSAGKPLIVGVGSNCTRSTTQDAVAVAGAVSPAALLVVAPYYTRPSTAGIVSHFRAVAEAVDVPIVVYNVPYRTGVSLDAGVLLELASIPGIAGVKQAVGSLDRDTLAVLRDKPATFGVLAGDDAFIVPTILMGGVGAIAAAAHVCTPAFVHMVEAARRGAVDEAANAASALLPIIDAGFAEPNPAVWKAVLHRCGELATPAVRSPLQAASCAATERAVAAIRTIRE